MVWGWVGSLMVWGWVGGSDGVGVGRGDVVNPFSYPL